MRYNYVLMRAIVHGEAHTAKAVDATVITDERVHGLRRVGRPDLALLRDRPDDIVRAGRWARPDQAGEARVVSRN